MQQESQRGFIFYMTRGNQNISTTSPTAVPDVREPLKNTSNHFIHCIRLPPSSKHPSVLSVQYVLSSATFNHWLLWFMLSNICVLFVKCQHETVNVLTSSGLGCFSASLNKNIFISRHYSVWLCVIFGFGGLFALTSRSAVTDVSDLVWTGSCDLCVTSLFSFSDIRL